MFYYYYDCNEALIEAEVSDSLLLLLLFIPFTFVMNYDIML